MYVFLFPSDLMRSLDDFQSGSEHVYSHTRRVAFHNIRHRSIAGDRDDQEETIESESREKIIRNFILCSIRPTIDRRSRDDRMPEIAFYDRRRSK